MATVKKFKDGRAELRAALAGSKRLFLAIGVFSFFVNLLMLTGPLYMLQVYDRVLTSRSEATLIALTVLVILLYALSGALDYARARILARIGARFQTRLDRRVFEAVLRRSIAPTERTRPASGLRDLEAIQRLMSSPAPFAAFDIPWTPVFIAMLFLFHWVLGVAALLGGAVIVSLTFLNQYLSRRPLMAANAASAESEAFAENLRRESELVHGMGMREAGLQRWKTRREASLEATITASDTSGTISNISKSFRYFMQSLMLGLGAFLVLAGEMSGGMMIAGSILLGRALAPIEQSIAQWSVIQRARQGWTQLSELLEKTPEEPERTELPRPRALMTGEQITVVPPGDKAATLRMVSFRIEPGQAMGVIGPSGSGKSTLARVITGIWRPASGTVRLDGAALEHYSNEALGQHIGYLPQDVALFDATVAENIARLSLAPDPQKVVEAARKAGAHEMILKLPEGYDTRIESGGSRLSGGQRQRLGLARALYGDPVMLVLDEPNSNLDSIGSDALNRAIQTMKNDGRAVIIMAHRPAAIAMCDTLLLLDGGMRKAFGPRDEVLREHLRNFNQVAGAIGADKRPTSIGAEKTS
ncbi:type I secretion system permease/ATPase [Paroceanicella profunda]|uniref:Type I secretion system permease/ATPase n=1 Tax=Paroceanicella profunda TaxID=2579971 RepID=A0A5B8G1G6_9RHOB|nr:type I secretion system permease/ATPase [Paroceanicella profunda]QDL92323.1 type I secretion system permease/ATPase [Paroceanicella profunda]